MRYDELVRLFGAQGYFDLASAVQLASQRRESLRVQLSRWCKAGKLLPLRRGMYAFPDRYSGRPGNPAELANLLCAPSYLSGHWALGYLGLIPERVTIYTSVTSRGPRTFENCFGRFKYRHIKPAGFFGYQPTDIDGRRVLLAEPEKALLDLWYLEASSWDRLRMKGMRFQSFDLVQPDKLRAYATRFASPRLRLAAETWLLLSDEEREETVEL